MLLLLIVAAVTATSFASPKFPLNPSDPKCQALETSCEDLYTSLTCSTTKQCIPRWEKMPIKTGNDTELCALCKQMVKEARDQLISNQTQDELRQVLYGSCDILVPTSALKTMCKETMDAFIEQLDDILVSRMDPTQVCTVSGLCYTTKSSDVVEQFNKIILARGSKSAPCEGFVGKIQSVLPRIRNYILMEGMGPICQLSGTRPAKCEQLISLYGNALIQFLRQNSAKAVCDFQVQKGTFEVPAEGDLQCEFCEAMVHKVVVQFNNTTTKQQVKAILTELCSKTGEWKNECMSKIENDVDRAYDEVISLLNPPVICKLLALCTEQTGPLKKITPASFSSSNYAPKPKAVKGTCDTCKSIVGYAVDALENNKTRDNIIAVLEKGCQICPIEPEKCQAFIDKNIEKLFELLQTDLSAEKICGALALCETTKIQVFNKPVEGTCDTCKSIVGYAVDALENNKTRENIVAVLEKGCQICPIEPGKCQEFIEKNMEKLFELLQTDLSAEKICEALSLCETPKIQVFKKPLEVSCEFCKTIIGYAVDELKNDKKVGRVELVLETGCMNLPINSEKCHEFIDTHIEALFDLLLTDMSAEKICETLSLCGTRKIQAYRAPVMPKSENCELCKIVTDWVLKELKGNTSEQAILATLEKVCKIIPGDKIQCKNIIDVYGDIIIKYIQGNYAAEQICAAIQLCPTKVVDQKCDVCQSVSTWVLSELKDNRTEEAIKSVLERACKILPMDRNQCETIIDSYSEKIIQLISADLSPEEICMELGLCPKQLPKKIVNNGEGCDVCKIVAQTVLDNLKDDKNEKSILAELEKVCIILPMDKVQCKNIVDVYGDQLIKAIQNDLTADEICSAIRLCPASQRRPTLRRQNAPLKDDCYLCTIIIDTIIADISNNKTEARIVEALEKVCTVIPQNYKSQCNDYVSKYGDKVINLIINELSSATICSQLGLCATAIRSENGCNTCQIFVYVVESYLQNNGTQAEIKFYLEKACSALEKPEDQKLCHNMVDVYTGYVISMLNGYATPQEICQTLSFCPTPPTNVKCEVCEFITNYVESQLSDNRTKEEIEGLLSKVCSLMPKSNVAQCRATIEQYSDMILSLLTQLVPPRKICEEIKLCPVAAIKKPVLDKVKDEKCSLCKWLVSWVDEKIVNNRTEEKIKQEIYKACDLLEDSNECKAMVSDYLDMIVKMLVSYADPERVCEAIGKCQKKTLTTNGRDEPPCRYCQYVVNELRDDVNKTEPQLKAKLDQICSMIPVNKVDCQKFVDSYADSIVKLILEKTDAEMMCEALHLCTAKTPQKRLQLQSAESCSYCKSIVGFVADQVKDETTDDVIIYYVEKVCNEVPVAYRKRCQVFIETQGTVLVRMLAQSINPESVCEAVKFCPVSPSNSPVVCTWCEYALHFIQDKLYDNSTQQTIIQDLDKVCATLPSKTMVNDCMEFVKTYGPAMDVVIAQKLDPSIVCPAIHACPTQRKTIRSLSATARCYDCVNTLGEFHHKPTNICDGANAQFFEKCQQATRIGSSAVKIIGDYQVCKFAKRCGPLNGKFDCNAGGCKYVQ